MELIPNRVAQSSLITFDLEQLYTEGTRTWIDLKEIVFQESIIREKDVRNYVQKLDGTLFQNHLVAIACSADVVVPTWAYMLVASAVSPFAQHVVFGTLNDLEEHLYWVALQKIDWEQFRDAKLVVKGCSRRQVPISAYVETIHRLRPLASSIMYGEACSAVPLYKK